jgi:hypothetical protein
MGVHTSAMLRVEQEAAEWMFANGCTDLLFATGTLAQGLNLPAIAVIISGTSAGDKRGQSPRQLERKANETILNGFGRAGRPGFSNQAIAILVGDAPIKMRLSRNADPDVVRKAYPVLTRRDAAVTVQSPIEQFIDDVMDEELFSGATGAALDLVALLSELDGGDGDGSDGILEQTFGAYRKRKVFTPEVAARVRARINLLKQEFLAAPNVPEWISRAAMKSGVSLVRALSVWKAFAAVAPIELQPSANKSVLEWLEVLIDVLKRLTPTLLYRYAADDQASGTHCRIRIRDLGPSPFQVDPEEWATTPEWDQAWEDLKAASIVFMRGGTYAEVAAAFLDIPVVNVTSERTQGKDLPNAFKFVSDVIENALALDAGCFVAVYELAASEAGFDATDFESLQSLPLCIRNGLDSLDTLAWFRFAVRQRACAHAFSKLFPIPNSVEGDAAKRRWVGQAYRSWTASPASPAEAAFPALAGLRALIRAEHGGLGVLTAT